MGRKAIDMTGRVYGRLTVLERVGTAYSPSFNATPLWRCRCECGNVLDVRGNSLRSGNTRSCGCLSAELAKERMKKNNPKRRAGNG